MSNVGVIYYADAVINLYRKNVDLSVPVWNELNSFQILYRRLKRLNIAGSVLLLPEQLCKAFSILAEQTQTDIISFNTSQILEKPYGLNQQHWGLENSSNNDSWYGEAFAKVFEKYDWQAAILIPLTNLLVDANDVDENLNLYLQEGFEVCLAEERIPGAEWAIFNRDLILGLYRSHPEIMKARGALYWAVKKPLYPFRVGSYHCPRIRPSINANMRLNSLRALNCYREVAPDNFDSPDFSYGDFINNSGWEKAYLDYAPLQINVEPSSFCNANCDGCPHSELKRDKCNLSAELLERAITDIEDKDMRIVFSGIGEPLLNTELKEMLKMTSGFCTTLQTSLQVMPDDDFPYEAVDHIRISIDADVKSSFGRLRKGCSWQNIEDFIEKHSEIKSSFDKRFPEIGLDYLRRGASEADILPFLKKWKKLCKPVFKGDFFRWPYDEKPDKISWYQISGQSAFCGSSENTSTVSFEPFKRRPCKNAFDLTILSDGRVTGCPYDAEGNYFYLGNLKDNSLMEIWNSQIASNWREKHLLIKLNKDCYCKNCHDWYNMF
jgi:radical SAM protein with 4Fe4S-binding SPASM domain